MDRSRNAVWIAGSGRAACNCSRRSQASPSSVRSRSRSRSTSRQSSNDASSRLKPSSRSPFIAFIECRGAQASDERMVGQCRLQLGDIGRDDVRVQCEGVSSRQNHRQSVADRSPDPCERLAKALPSLCLRRVAPQERGDLLARVEPAGRKRQVSEQRLTVARFKELEAQSNRVGTASWSACHVFLTRDSEHHLQPRKRTPCVRGSNGVTSLMQSIKVNRN